MHKFDYGKRTEIGFVSALGAAETSFKVSTQRDSSINYDYDFESIYRCCFEINQDKEKFLRAASGRQASRRYG